MITQINHQFNNNTLNTLTLAESVYAHDFEIMSGSLLLACLAIFNGNFCVVVSNIMKCTPCHISSQIKPIENMFFVWLFRMVKGLSPVTRNLYYQSARGNRSGAVRYFPEAVRPR